MTSKKLCIILMFSILLVIPIFGQTATPKTITIREDKLEQIISDRVSKAVDEAVAAAVKEVEIKHLDEVKTLKSTIIDKDNQLTKEAGKNTEWSIKYDNLTTQFNAYKTDVLGNYFAVGGLSLFAGLVGGGIIGFEIHK